MPLHTFKANVASSLVSAKKSARGRPSAEFKLNPLSSKLVQVQSTPMSDIRLDGIDRMPNWDERRERFHQCLTAIPFNKNLFQ